MKIPGQVRDLESLSYAEGVTREFIFREAPFASCHASTIVETNGVIAAAWFGGLWEGHNEVGIWISRYENGRWSFPKEIANGLGANGLKLACYNPVLYQTGEGPLILFYKIGEHPSCWKGFCKHSWDGGATWSISRPLPRGIIGPDKNKPMCVECDWLLCGTSVEGKTWRVRFELTRDYGRTWRRTPFVSSCGIDAIQPCILTLGGRGLLALGRTQNGRIFQTRSNDSGRSWGPLGLIHLPNPNSGVDAITLADGRHLLVYNHSDQRRSPLVAAISEDASFWKPLLILERGLGEFSYPACIQSADGKVHVTYTWNRVGIRYVRFDPAIL